MVPTLDGSEVLYEELFESCPAEWTTGSLAGMGRSPRSGSTWECGTPVAEPGGDHDGTGLAWATGLDGPYGRHEVSSLASPVIDLSEHVGEELRLTMSVWYDFSHNPDQDFGGAFVEGWDGNSWVRLEPHGGWDGELRAPGTPLDRSLGLTDSGPIQQWRRLVFDIGDLTGTDFQARVVLANRHPHRGSGIAVDTVRVERLESPRVRASDVAARLAARHRERIAALLATLPREERERALDHLFWRGIAPAELQVRRNPFGAVGSLTGLFLGLPPSDDPTTVFSTPAEAAEAFLAEFGRDLFGAESVDELVMVPDSPALAHGPPGAVIFDQRYEDLSVEGARAEVFVDGELRVYAAFGTVVPGFVVDPRPALDLDRAARTAERVAADETGEDCEATDGGLVGWNGALFEDADEDHLAWRIEVGCTGARERIVHVDAHEGEVLRTEDPIKLQFAEDVPGIAFDGFIRFSDLDDTESEEDCFGRLRLPCVTHIVWFNGECAWHYEIEDGELVPGGTPSVEGRPANCELEEVEGTNKLLRSLDALAAYIREQPWGEYDVADVVGGCVLGGRHFDGFCVSFNIGRDEFGSLPTIGYANELITIRPTVGGPHTIGHEEGHEFLEGLGLVVSGALGEHIGDILGAITTRRVLSEDVDPPWPYAVPDLWVAENTTDEAKVLVQAIVRDNERPCSVLGYPGAGIPLVPKRPEIDDDAELDSRRSRAMWRSLREPWLGNRDHCVGAGSVNEEWLTAKEAYALYYEAGTDDGVVAATRFVLSHTNVGIGNKMLYQFTEGGSHRGFVIDEPRNAAETEDRWTDLEQTVFGAMVTEWPHAGTLDWSGYAAALARTTQDLARVRGGGEGFELALSPETDRLLDAAASVSLWTEETKLLLTDAHVGDRLAVVSYVTEGAGERLYVFYRGRGNQIHYRWLDVQAHRYPGTPLEEADGAWHPSVLIVDEGPLVRDCVVPDAVTTRAPTLVTRHGAVWVGWVQRNEEGENEFHAKSFQALPEGLDDCVDSWSEDMRPAIDRPELAELYPLGFLPDGPATLVALPLGLFEHHESRGFHCERSDEAEGLAYPLGELGLLSADAWSCRLLPEGTPVPPVDFPELQALVDTVVNPATVRGTLVFGFDPEAPSRTDEEVGGLVAIDPAPYAAVDYGLRAALESNPLFGGDFADAFDGSGAREGHARVARFEVAQDLLPRDAGGTGGGSLGERDSIIMEMHFGMEDTELFLVWLDDGFVFIHPWDPFVTTHPPGELSEDECFFRLGVFRDDGSCDIALQPQIVMESTIPPAAVSHRFGEMWGVYVFGADEDGAVQVAHSTSEHLTVEGLMEFGSPQVLMELMRPPEPRPPLYRAWTDKPLAVWARPSAGRPGMLHFVLAPLLGPVIDDDRRDRRLGFQHGVTPNGFLGGVLETDRVTGDVELPERERLFQIGSAWVFLASEPGGGVASHDDVVYYFDVPTFRSGFADIAVRSKVGR